MTVHDGFLECNTLYSIFWTKTSRKVHQRQHWPVWKLSIVKERPLVQYFQLFTALPQRRRKTSHQPVAPELPQVLYFSKLANYYHIKSDLFVSVHNGLIAPKFAASKNLNFTSPLGKSTPRKILPQGWVFRTFCVCFRAIVNTQHFRMFLLPVGTSPLVSPLASPRGSTPNQVRLIAAHSDSGLGSSPAVFLSPPNQ